RVYSYVSKLAGQGRSSTRCTRCRTACLPADRHRTSVVLRGWVPASAGMEEKGLLRFQPGRGRELARLQEFGVEEFRLVAGAGIGEDRDDRVPGPELAREANGAAHIDPGRAAEHQPFLGDEIEQCRQHLGISDLVLPVRRKADEVA